MHLFSLPLYLIFTYFCLWITQYFNLSRLFSGQSKYSYILKWLWQERHTKTIEIKKEADTCTSQCKIFCILYADIAKLKFSVKYVFYNFFLATPWTTTDHTSCKIKHTACSTDKLSPAISITKKDCLSKM